MPEEVQARLSNAYSKVMKAEPKQSTIEESEPKRKKVTVLEQSSPERQEEGS